jgi:hypothetical protein
MSGRNRLLTAGLAAGLGWAAVGNSSKAADGRPRLHAHGARQARAPAQVPPTENLVVHGKRRFSTAPVPDQEIHDPADAFRDPNTGVPLGRFGRAFTDANPVPPVNPGLKTDESPVMVGLQR